MASNYVHWLAQADNTGGINLNDETNYAVPWGNPVAPPAPAGKPRVITIKGLSVRGATPQDIITNVQAIENLLTDAARAWGPQGHTTVAGGNVVYQVQLNSNDYVHFDVRRGVFHYDGQGLLDIIENGHVVGDLILECEPFGRGTPVTYAVSATLTNGPGAVVSLPGIPGDEDPLTKVVLTDTSAAGYYINTVQLGRRALRALASTDAVGAIAASGTVTVSAVDTWFTLLTANQPASTPQMHGDHHIGVTLTDNETRLAQPQGLTVTPHLSLAVVQTASGSLTSSPTWTSPTTAGNTLMLVTVTTAGSPQAPSIWTQAGSVPGGATITVWTIQNAAAQNYAVSIAGNPTGTWFLAEIQGATGVASLVTNSGTGTSASTAGSGSGTGIEWFIAASSAAVTWSGLTSGYTALYQTVSGTPSSIIARDISASVSLASATLSASNPWTAAAITFTAPTGSIGAALPAGTYSVQVGATATSAVGQASVLAVATLTQPGLLAVSWSAVTGATGYRVYVNAGTGWDYATTTGTSLTITAMPAIAGVPVASPGVLQVRAAVQVQGASTWQYGDAVSITYGNGSPEDLALGVLPLPPVVPQDGTAPPSWTLAIQVYHGSSTGFTVSGSTVWAFPADQDATFCTYPGQSMSRQAVWTFDVNRWGDRFSCLLDDGTSLQPNAPFRLGPGDNLLFIHLGGENGAGDVTNLACTVQVTVTPRYRLLAP